MNTTRRTLFFTIAFILFYLLSVDPVFPSDSKHIVPMLYTLLLNDEEPKCFIPMLYTLLLSDEDSYKEKFYVTEYGAGDPQERNGKTPENAWSVNNFNDPNFWSKNQEAAIDGLIGPGDVVYFSGTITSELFPQGSGNARAGAITLDGYKAGDCSPASTHTPCSGAANMCNTIHIDVDYVTVVDMNVPENSGHFFIRAGRNKRVDGLTVSRCYLGLSKSVSALNLAFVNYGEFSWNYVKAPDAWLPLYTFPDGSCNGEGCCKGTFGRGFELFTGSYNRFVNNYIVGGYTAVIFLHKLVWDSPGEGRDTYSYGTYTNDPLHNLIGNEVAYNTIICTCEEGISFDPAYYGAPGYWGVVSMEWDTVSSTNPGTNTITLSHTNWSSCEDDRYSGAYIFSMRENDTGFGEHSLIESHSGANFVVNDLSGDMPNLDTNGGDKILIAYISKHNWIHDNTWPGAGSYYEGFGGSSILMETTAVANLIENNTMQRRNLGTVVSDERGISTIGLYNHLKPPDSITGTVACFPQAFNVIRNNHSYATVISNYNVGYYEGHSYGTAYAMKDRNNTFSGNTYQEDVSGSDSGARLFETHAYVAPGQEISETSNYTPQGSDHAPVTPAVIYPMFYPGIQASSITQSAGTYSLNITLTRSCTGGTTGNGGFTLDASGGEASLSYSNGTGTSRVYTISRSIGENEVVYLNYTPGNIAATSGTKTAIPKFVNVVVQRGNGF